MRHEWYKTDEVLAMKMLWLEFVATHELTYGQHHLIAFERHFFDYSTKVALGHIHELVHSEASLRNGAESIDEKCTKSSGNVTQQTIVALRKYSLIHFLLLCFVNAIPFDDVYSVNEMDFIALHRCHDRRQRPCREDRKVRCLTNRIVFSANRRTINWNYLPLALHLVGQLPRSSLLLVLSVRQRIHRIALAPVLDWGHFT